MSPNSDQEQPAAAALPPELAQIALEAEAIQPPPMIDQANPEQAQADQVDYQEDAALLVGMLFEGCAEIYPSTGVVLAPKQTRFSKALGKVMEKNQWSIAAILGRWGAEIELAFVASTLAIPMVKAISADRAKSQAEKQQLEAAHKNPDPQPARPASDPYSSAFPDPAAA